MENPWGYFVQSSHCFLKSCQMNILNFVVWKFTTWIRLIQHPKLGKHSLMAYLARAAIIWSSFCQMSSMLDKWLHCSVTSLWYAKQETKTKAKIKWRSVTDSKLRSSDLVHKNHVQALRLKFHESPSGLPCLLF